MLLFDTNCWNDTQQRKLYSHRFFFVNEATKNSSVSRPHCPDSKSLDDEKGDGAVAKPLSSRWALRRESIFSSYPCDFYDKVMPKKQAYLKHEKTASTRDKKFSFLQPENVESLSDDVQWTHLIFAISVIVVSVVVTAVRKPSYPQDLETRNENIRALFVNFSAFSFNFFSKAFILLYALLHKMLLIEIRRKLWRVAIKGVKSFFKRISVIQHPYFYSVKTNYIPQWIRRGLTKLFMKKVKKNVDTYVKDALEDGIAAGEISSILVVVQNAWSLSLAQEYFIAKTLRVAKELIRRLIIIEFKRKIWSSLFAQLKKLLGFILAHEYFFLSNFHVPKWIRRGAKKILKKNVNSAVKGCWSYGKDEVMSAINECLCTSLEENSAKELTCSLSFSFGFSWAQWDFWDGL